MNITIFIWSFDMVNCVARECGFNLGRIGNANDNFSGMVFWKAIFVNGQIHFDNDMTMIYKLVEYNLK